MADSKSINQGLFKAFQKKALIPPPLTNPNPSQNPDQDKSVLSLETQEHPGMQKLLDQPQQNLINIFSAKEAKSKYEYDPDKYPPDIKMAKDHAKARRVSIPRYLYEEFNRDEAKKTSEEAIDLCDCCGCPIENEILELNSSKYDLFFLGSGFPLFFEFITWGVGLLLLIFCLSSIYCLITNSLDRSTTEKEDTWFINLSLRSNTNARSDRKKAQMIVNFITILCTMVYLQFFRRKQRKTAFECDMAIVTPTDYSVKISNLPLNFKDHDLKEYFEKLGGDKLKISMVKMNKCYNISKYVDLLSEKNSILQQKRSYEERIMEKNELLQKSQTESQKAKYNQEVKFCQTKIDEITIKFEAIEKNLNIEKKLLESDSAKFTGTAYVIFNTPQQAQFVKRALKKSFSQKFKIWWNKSSDLSANHFFQGNMIYCDKAPEPNDILWENLGVDWGTKFKKQMQTAGYTFLLLLGCFFGILGITYGQNAINKSYKDSFNTITLNFINSLGAILISVINYLLNFIIRRFAVFEKHSSYTGFDTSIAQKKTIAQFMNTGVIYIIISWLFDNWDNKVGLINQLLNIYISTLIVNSLLFLFDPMYLLKLYQQRKVIKQGAASFMTQSEAHALFEGPNLDVPNLYSAILNIMLLSAFYATLTPLVVLFGIIILSVFYFIFKFLLLRRCSIPVLLGKEIAYAMVEYAEYVPFIMALGDVLFNIVFYDEPNGWSITALCICFINFALPMTYINRKIFTLDEKHKIQSESPDYTKEYNVARVQFTFEYDRLNPITQKKAVEDWVKFIEKKDDKNATPNKELAKNLLTGLKKMSTGSPKGGSEELKENIGGEKKEEEEKVEEHKIDIEEPASPDKKPVLFDSSMENYALFRGKGLGNVHKGNKDHDNPLIKMYEKPKHNVFTGMLQKNLGAVKK